MGWGEVGTISLLRVSGWRVARMKVPSDIGAVASKRVWADGLVTMRVDLLSSRKYNACSSLEWGVMAKTIDQKTNIDGFPKAGELIEISGAHELEASDRAALNILYRLAHDSGRLGEKDAEWNIPIKDLRLSSTHNSTDRVRDSLRRLMKVVVTIPFRGQDEREHVLLTHLFDFFDLPSDEENAVTTIRFGLPRKLQPILMRSGHWGRIKSEIICAMTSKYAMQLYELIQLRANMGKSIEVFTLDQFRSKMNIPPNTYSRGHDLVKYVIEPSVLEVNGLSDMGVDIQPRRKHAKAPIYEVAVAWWRKEGNDFRSALKERQRSKVGRLARLRGLVETVE